jgi:hypothetical protein
VAPRLVGRKTRLRRAFVAAKFMAFHARGSGAP